MRLATGILMAWALTIPAIAMAQDSTTPSTDCSVSGGCSSTGSGSQPNTTPDSTLEGGTSGSTSGSGTLDDTSPGTSADPGSSSDSSGSGGLDSGGGSGGAAGPLNNTTPD